MRCDKCVINGKTVLRPANLDKDYLMKQASYMYDLAISIDDEAESDICMGIAAMLYHLHSGFYVMSVEDETDNRRGY